MYIPKKQAEKLLKLQDMINQLQYNANDKKEPLNQDDKSLVF